MNFSSSIHRPKIRWIVFGIILAIFFLILRTFVGNENILLKKSGLLAVPWPKSLEFCNEPVPLENFYIREAWEREFLITLARDYQNILYLKRAPKFFTLIESELVTRQLPDDLKYMAVAESALRESIRSSAGAEGIWQFIPETAQRYGLRVDEKIDERRNFEKATPAALNYMEFLHEKFGSWTLAAASYNAGENGIARRLTEQAVESYYDLYLNPETSRYLFRILAIKEIMSNPKKYGYNLRDSDYFEYPEFKIISIGGHIPDLAVWAREQKTNLRTIKELNPWIVKESLPEGSWKIKIPR